MTAPSSHPSSHGWIIRFISCVFAFRRPFVVGTAVDLRKVKPLTTLRVSRNGTPLTPDHVNGDLRTAIAHSLGPQLRRMDRGLSMGIHASDATHEEITFGIGVPIRHRGAISVELAPDGSEAFLTADESSSARFALGVYDAIRG